MSEGHHKDTFDRVLTDFNSKVIIIPVPRDEQALGFLATSRSGWRCIHAMVCIRAGNGVDASFNKRLPTPSRIQMLNTNNVIWGSFIRGVILGMDICVVCWSTSTKLCHNHDLLSEKRTHP